MTKTKSNGKKCLVWKTLVYLMLAGALFTYVCPFVRVRVPALGTRTWSVRDMVQTASKVIPSKTNTAQSFNPSFDFIDFIRELLPRGEGFRLEQERTLLFVMGAFVPLALIVVYVTLVLTFFLALLKNGNPYAWATGIMNVCVGYVIGSIYFFNHAAHESFGKAITSAKANPFFLVTERLVQDVSLEPAKGAWALIAFTAVLFVVGLLRLSKKCSNQ